MKNTLEGITERITEAEEWISDLEEKMVEIAASEQNRGKRMKSHKRQFKRSLGQYQMHQHSHYRSPRRRRQRQNVKKQ